MRAGKLPGAPLEQMLRDHSVGAVVLGHDIPLLRTIDTNRWPSSFLDAVEERLTRQPLVGAGVVRRHATLVPPEEHH